MQRIAELPGSSTQVAKAEGISASQVLRIRSLVARLRAQRGVAA